MDIKQKEIEHLNMAISGLKDVYPELIKIGENITQLTFDRYKNLKAFTAYTDGFNNAIRLYAGDSEMGKGNVLASEKSLLLWAMLRLKILEEEEKRDKIINSSMGGC
jgi:hypothetical protein